MNETRNSTKTYAFMSALSAIGAAVSIWQTHLYFETRTGMGSLKSFCNIGQTFDCTAVEMSNYAELLRGVPVSGFAVAGYLVILILSILGFNSRMKKTLKPWLVGFTGIAFLFSVIYLFIMLTQIGKLCLLCLFVDSVNVILFILALTSQKREAGSEGITPTHIVSIGAGSILIAGLVTLALNPQREMKDEDLNDIVESVLASPETPFALPADAPFIGDANAPITIVKFSDYECPACKMGAQGIHPLFKRYPKEVKFVFLNFPLAQECNPDAGLKRTIHVFACEAAAAAVCATEQGKFAETYEALFENQKDFEQGKIADLLTTKVPSLQIDRLKECMKLPSTSDKIRRDAAVGALLKVRSTPTFFLNQKKIEGGLPTNLWIRIIDRTLKK